MLTIIGTGHVFRISEAVSFLTRQSWPDAVCVELDVIRFHALTGDKEALRNDLRERRVDPDTPPEERMKNAPSVYRKTAKYQEKVSKQNNVSAGADMVAAIGAARSVDAQIFCIDVDGQAALCRMWEEMPRAERFRYRISGIADNLFKRSRVEKTQKDYSRDQAAYIEEMRKKYPTLVRVLIDERNEHMAKELAKICSEHKQVVAVVGDGHVDGILRLLPDVGDVRVVRLADLMDPDKLNKIKNDFWEAPEQ